MREDITKRLIRKQAKGVTLWAAMERTLKEIRELSETK